MNLLFVIAGCGSAGDAEGIDRLVRASMTLRGVRPSLAELEEVRRDDDALETIARGWLDDPRFGATIRDLHAEQLLLRYDTRAHAPPIGPLLGWAEADTIARLDEEPLMLIEHLVLGGRPYSEIVTADVTMADPVTSIAYGLEYPPGATGWVESRYLDGRPMAGILSTTALMQRYMNSDTNHHRSRANLLLDKLLCDPLAGAVITDPTVEDVMADPACAGCHAELDPLASSFWGFGTYFLESEIREAYVAGCPEGSACYPVRMWDPAWVADQVGTGMPESSLDTVPVSDLGDLGDAIAADPRFATCTARRFVSWLGQIPLAEVEAHDVARFTAVLTDSGFDARELALAIAIDPALAPSRTHPRMVRPETLARMMDDLTGWRWEAEVDGYGRVEFGATDEYGLRSLMGGVDGWNSVRPDLHPTATRELALEWLATEAASVAVDDGGLLPDGPVDRPGEVRRTLRDLHLRLLGEPDPDLDASIELFEGALDRSGDPAHAWKVTLTALLLDERLVTY